MITKIILIRHGQTKWNAQGRFQGQSDTELLPEGIAQAKLLAQHFPLTKLDAIYCSDLSRARQTAQPIADKFKLKVQPCSRLREMNFGVWEGMLFDDINKKWPDAMRKFFDDPLCVNIPEAENFEELEQRAVQAVEEIITNNNGKTVAIVAHGAVNKAVLGHIMHVPLAYSWAILQSNTAYNIFSYDDKYKKFYIETVNNTSHLLK